jgi:inositol oxygenase
MERDKSTGPLASLEQWEEDVLERYPEPEKPAANRFDKEFRNYEDPARASVREFYRLNHEHQSLEFARAKKAEYGGLSRRKMGVWEACEYLNTLVDDSDPDTDLTQIEHLLQTAEAIRADGKPDWFVLTGLIHDLGKILCLWDEPQWAVVGDTFPLGCRFSDKVVYPEYFDLNPDSKNPELMTECGIYEEGCGLENVTMSWGHDEYMYTVTKDYLPEPALYMIRYHSFYAAHREGAYAHLMNARDREMFQWVKAFNPYDLYSKADSAPKTEELRPYYEDLIAKYFPDEVAW